MLTQNIQKPSSCLDKEKRQESKSGLDINPADKNEFLDRLNKNQDSYCNVTPNEQELTLLNKLTSFSENLHEFLDQPYVKQISVDKMEISIGLSFEISALDQDQINILLRNIAKFSSNNLNDSNLNRSCITGGYKSRGMHRDTEAAWTNRDGYTRKQRTSFLIQPRKRNKTISAALRGHQSWFFSRINPEILQQGKLPAPLHNIVHMDIQWIEHIDKSITQVTKRSLEVTYKISLNPNRAIVHHPYIVNPALSRQQAINSFFPNCSAKSYGENDNFCPPGISQQSILIAIKNILEINMRIFYADLKRAMRLAIQQTKPLFPINIDIHPTWREHLHWSKLDYIEINRHVCTDNANRFMSLCKNPLRMALNNLWKREHGKSPRRHKQHAYDTLGDSLRCIIRNPKSGQSKAQVALCIYPKDKHHVRIELRLSGYDGIHYSRDKTSGGNVVADSYESLVMLIFNTMLDSQTRFDKILNRVPSNCIVDRDTLKSFEQIFREDPSVKDPAMVDQLMEHLLCTGIIYAKDHSHDICKFLRSCVRRGIFISKGSRNNQKYIPSLDYVKNKLNMDNLTMYRPVFYQSHPVFNLNSTRYYVNTLKRS